MLKRRMQGFTLLEFMIAGTLGLLVLLGVVAIYTSGVTNSLRVAQQQRFDQELSRLVGFMKQEVRRIGYGAARPNVDADGDGDVGDLDDLAFNPFTNDTVNVTVSQMTGESNNTCLLYAYNLDDDSPARIGFCDSCNPSSAPFNATPYDNNNMEMFGIRLNSGQFELRTGPSAASDSSFSCDTGEWAPLSADAMNFTAVAFALTQTQHSITDGDNSCESGDACLIQRRLNIQMTATSLEDARLNTVVNESVALRNDRYVGSMP